MSKKRFEIKTDNGEIVLTDKATKMTIIGGKNIANMLNEWDKDYSYLYELFEKLKDRFVEEVLKYE